MKATVFKLQPGFDGGWALWLGSDDEGLWIEIEPELLCALYSQIAGNVPMAGTA